MTNPIYDPYQILFKVYSEGAYLKEAISSCIIEELNRARTVKICYGVLENDIYLDYCIKSFSQKSAKLPIRIILKISLYMLLFMNKQKYMVTDNAVEICKKLGKKGVSGFINAFLRNFDESKVQLPNSKVKGLSIKYSYPEFAVRKIVNEYGKQAESILTAKTCGVSVRFESQEFAKKFLDKEFISTPFENNYLFKNFKREEGYDRGEYTFQSVGSIAICDIVEPCQEFLDSCSAPGGKSVLLSKKCKSIISTELHPHRVELIKSYAERMKVTNVTAINADSTILKEEFIERFDGVLCDVPCSGYGTITENPDIKLFRKEEDVSSLNKIQIQILENCSNYVKQGGYLYYSTCSIFREENDNVVWQFLDKHKNFEVQEISSKLNHKKTKFGLQFLPDLSLGVGFYVCKLKKV